MTEETKLPNTMDMTNDLMTNYIEMYHEDADMFNPDAYEEYLNGLDDDELTELWLETYGDY